VENGGAAEIPTFPHALRRGMYSLAASRLDVGEVVPPLVQRLNSQTHSKSPISRAKNAREMGHPQFRWDMALVRGIS